MCLGDGKIIHQEMPAAPDKEGLGDKFFLLKQAVTDVLVSAPGLPNRGQRADLVRIKVPLYEGNIDIFNLGEGIQSFNSRVHGILQLADDDDYYANHLRTSCISSI